MYLCHFHFCWFYQKHECNSNSHTADGVICRAWKFKVRRDGQEVFSEEDLISAALYLLAGLGTSGIPPGKVLPPTPWAELCTGPCCCQAGKSSMAAQITLPTINPFQAFKSGSPSFVPSLTDSVNLQQFTGGTL